MRDDIAELRRRLASQEQGRVPAQELGAAVAGGAVWVQIKTHVATINWTCDVYADGRYSDAGVAKSATASGAALIMPDLSASATEALNEWCLAVEVDGHYEGYIATWR